MKKIEIDVSSNKLFVVNNGEILAFNPPTSGYGEQVVVWVSGKVGHIKTTSNEKIK
ncbi:DUF3954 domain-containing protein [Bacillus sp. AY1-10]|uniref:DUF3954 domain-containing protein n=1 Tax=Bacillus sp. AY1-10 TaxID=2217823 RepID=UPI0011EE4D19|nr:DUF3954 domain-containing protein [Bacillus sp. AY1-10]KAA0752854.1 DUF3954 domain-containing protein [Bacillus sp. AY1-10]MCU5427001.1 DUF3954 domain-containing protein [Bacillus cereus]